MVAGAAAKVAEPAKAPEPELLCTSAKAMRVALLRLELLAVLPMLAILVVSPALFGIAKHLVCLVNLLEPLLCLRVLPVYVGVVLLCQFAVGLFNLLLRCVTLHTQHLVVIDECHNLLF